ERHIEFFKASRNGSAPKRLPSVFITHYLAYSASKLPRVSALMTMPIVLGNGELLAANGLDKARKIVFRIDPAILKVLPQGPILGGEIEEAMRFLTDDWLVDVQTDYTGKCVLIALALSVIERELLSDRPAFFITAGKRGGGKTTAATMIAVALT